MKQRKSSGMIRKQRESSGSCVIKRRSQTLRQSSSHVKLCETNPEGEASELQAQLELIGDICNQLGNGSRINERLRFLSIKTRDLLKVDACVIRKLEGDYLEILHSCGVSESHLISRLCANTGIAKHLITNKRSIVIPDVSSDPWTSSINSKSNEKEVLLSIKTYAGVPMIIHDKVVGIIGVYTKGKEKRFSRSELNFLQIIANSAAMAMRNDHLAWSISGAETAIQIKIVELLKDSERYQKNEHGIDKNFNIISNNYLIEYDMRQGNLELIVHYQPIHQPGKVFPLGYEALLRSNHPQFGILQPNSFIPVAESSGLITTLGKRIQEMVAYEYEYLFRHKNPNQFITINVSILELSSADFSHNILSIFSMYGISPKNVVIELTERSPLEANSQALISIHQLSEMGFRIFLDDFGTGHTSLSYLMDYSFNGIKIDKNFLPTSFKDKKRMSVFGNIFKLANDLGLQVVAEGVETLEQMEICMSLQVDFLQGYGIGKPQPIIFDI